MSNTKKLNPVRNADFQLADHRFRRFDCTVPAGTTKKDLENPSLWESVAGQLRQGDEVRAISDDFSFVAYLLVTFSQGTDARLKVVNGADLDEVEATEVQGKYFIKMRGPKKWCVMNRETGEAIKENIAKQSEAQRELEDYVTALNR